MQRERDQCFIQVEAAVVDRMRSMRRSGESYSNVILRLVELEFHGSRLSPDLVDGEGLSSRRCPPTPMRVSSALFSMVHVAAIGLPPQSAASKGKKQWRSLVYLSGLPRDR